MTYTNKHISILYILCRTLKFGSNGYNLRHRIIFKFIYIGQSDIFGVLCSFAIFTYIWTFKVNTEYLCTVLMNWIR